ncbi:hypothetical protein [Acidovorax sp. SUPP2825]|uniref:hypothetical protein n=1 Tax=Acidovorax sp. SUPP2825 TaxID=2920879 RepID=UPI0023DE3CE8|nr:hypothetical protein [Acidovorax sp. SUPP2825]GKS96919.1 hypothetical protein AVAK2825_20310 [Acidovorax sp. SUPP2825]
MSKPSKRLTAIETAPINAGGHCAPFKTRTFDCGAEITRQELPVRNSTMSEPYKGAELRNTHHRAGAMDAYQLPSVTFAGVRHRQPLEA